MKQKLAFTLLILGLAFAAFFSVQTVLSVMGYPMFVVTMGDSMLPMINPFDLLILSPISPDEIELDMIVAVDHREGLFPFGTYIVHRVYEFSEKGDELWVTTKGDNNPGPDSRVPATDVVAKLVFMVPVVGIIFGPPLNLLLMLGLIGAAYKLFQKK